MPYGEVGGEAVMLALGEDYPELRQSVRKICEKYPGAYWRGLEDAQAYPTEFVEELTRAGFLASLIPEEYGGSGLPLRAAAVILEEINASGCTASQGHAQMYIMGHSAARQRRQKEIPARHRLGRLRMRAFGSPSRRPLRHHQAQDPAVRQQRTTTGRSQKVWTSRTVPT